jgi:menaquinone-dependent protoporphyrinogen oxidase
LRNAISNVAKDMKALIVYGTRYGATAGTSEEIAKILRGEGFDVKVSNLKEEKIRELSEYDLVVLGTGLQLGRWTGEAEDFLKKFKTELDNKKFALFVSTMKTVPEREGNAKGLAEDRKWDLDDKIIKWNLHPMSVGFFGGVINFNEMNFVARKTFGSIKKRLEAAGFKESEPGVYELRDWDEIRKWAKELAQKAKA